MLSVSTKNFEEPEFWRGIGAVELLDAEAPMIALRVSRKLSQRQIDEAVARIRHRIGDFIFVGGWISPGARRVCFEERRSTGCQRGPRLFHDNTACGVTIREHLSFCGQDMV